MIRRKLRTPPNRSRHPSRGRDSRIANRCKSDETNAQRMVTAAEFVARSAPLETPITGRRSGPPRLLAARRTRSTRSRKLACRRRGPRFSRRCSRPRSSSPRLRNQPRYLPPNTARSRTGDPERIETDPNVGLPASRPTAAHMPADLMAVGSQMQQLADVEARPETPDALVGSHDELSESENRGNSTPRASEAVG